MKKQPLWTQEFLGMSFSNFFQYMAHYSLIATLPVFIMENLQGDEWQAGLAMTFFQIGAVICRPFAGKWIDSYNKKKMAFFSLGMFLIISILYLLANNLPFLLGIRLLHGAVFAVGTTTAATLAVLVLPTQRKGEGIGYFAVFSNLAMVVGPFCGLLIISQYNFFALYLGIVFLAILAFWCGNRKNLPDAIIKPLPKKNSAFKITNFIEPKALSMALIGGFIFFAYAGVLVFIPLYTKMLHLSAYTSIFFAVFASVIVLTRPIIGKIFDRVGANAIIYPCFFFFFAGLLYLSRIEDLKALLIASAIIGIGFGGLSPAFQTLAIQNSPRSRAGVATATYFFALDVSVGLGSFFLSLAAVQIGYRCMYTATAILLIFAMVLYYLLSRKKSVKNPVHSYQHSSQS